MSVITEAASVILSRGPGSPEVFVVERSETLRFFGGYHAFPGGKVGEEDAQIYLRSSSGPISDPWRVAAARELFEETGTLIARQGDGSFPTSTTTWDQARRDLDSGEQSFARFLADQGLHLEAADFVAAGTLVTPPFSPVRFATAFFVAHLPTGQTTTVWPGELTRGFWSTPDAMLRRWLAGEAVVTPPTVSLLEAIRDRPADELPSSLAPVLAQLDAGAIPPIYFAPGVQMIPLRTIGLPPTTYTNAYLAGTQTLYLFDPGAHDPDEQQRLFDAVDSRLAQGGRLAAVVLTHHHPDHVNAAAAAARRYGVPVRGHRLTAQLLQRKMAVVADLEEGSRLDLGPTPDGASPWYLEALHTPGHAAGHLVFVDNRYRLLLAGDMVSMLSSVIIAPPDGDLAVYLDSLRRLRELDLRLLLPGHGSASIRPRQVLDETIAHRLRREEQLLAALRESPGRTTAELSAEIYRNLPPEMHKLARLQLLAGLTKLEQEGRVAATGKGEDCRWHPTGGLDGVP